MAYPSATWLPGTSYGSGTSVVVNYQGLDYDSLVSSNLGNIPSQTLGTKWQLHTTYVAGTTYASGNQVWYNGWYYTSLQNSNTGHTPSSSPTYWTVSGTGDWIERAGLDTPNTSGAPLVLPIWGRSYFGRVFYAGVRYGHFYYVNKVPSTIVGPDGLIILIGAPWNPNLGVPV